MYNIIKKKSSYFISTFMNIFFLKKKTKLQNAFNFYIKIEFCNVGTNYSKNLLKIQKKNFSKINIKFFFI